MWIDIETNMIFSTMILGIQYTINKKTMNIEV